MAEKTVKKTSQLKIIFHGDDDSDNGIPLDAFIDELSAIHDVLVQLDRLVSGSDTPTMRFVIKNIGPKPEEVKSESSKMD